MSDFLGAVDYEAFEHSRQAQQDETLLVKFFYQTIRDEEASREAGRACFKEREYIDIRVPGTKGSRATRPATAADKKRFDRHYQAFKQRVELPLEGTPLSEWPVISRSMAEELAFSGVKTVEQLAKLNDGVASNFMGGVTFKARAQEWLARANEDVTVDKLQGELAKRDAQIAELSDKLEQLMADKPKRKRRAKGETNSGNQCSDTGERPVEPSGSGDGAVTSI